MIKGHEIIFGALLATAAWAVLVIFSANPNIVDLSRIERWQTLTASFIAIGGVVLTARVAVRNVTRQIRVNILSREEDRIEKMLPGLRAATDFAGEFLLLRVTVSFIGIVEAFQSYGFGVKGSNFQKDVSNALPNTDGATRLSVEQRVYSCYNWGRIAENSIRTIRQWTAEIANPAKWDPSALEEKWADIDTQREMFAQARAQFSVAMDQLDAEIHRIRAQIALYEERSRHIRSELGAYFGEGI